MIDIMTRPRWMDAAKTAVIADLPGGATVVIPADPANGEFAALVEAGITIADAVPSLNAYSMAVDEYINQIARARGYDSALSCVSYASDPNPQWAAEAQAFIAWRSQAWASLYATLDAVQGGAKAPSVADVLGSLPAMEWPGA